MIPKNILKKDWYFQDDLTICSLRCAGILIKKDQILVQFDTRTSEYALVGGHVKIGENT